jgi:hypothetical protein
MYLCPGIKTFAAAHVQQCGGVFFLIRSEALTGRGGGPQLFAFRKTQRKRQYIGPPTRIAKG